MGTGLMPVRVDPQAAVHLINSKAAGNTKATV